jgi:hypothetical protein
MMMDNNNRVRIKVRKSLFKQRYFLRKKKLKINLFLLIMSKDRINILIDPNISKSLLLIKYLTICSNEYSQKEFKK